MLSGSRSTRTEEEVLANSVLQQEWRRLQGDESAADAAAEPCDASKPVEGDCPICYDEMHPGGGTIQVCPDSALALMQHHQKQKECPDDPRAVLLTCCHVSLTISSSSKGDAF